MVFAILLVILVMVIVVPVAIVAATRAVSRFDGGMTGRLDPALDDRLGRIEEAIDAMAMQIETLSQQQRALLSAPAEDARAPGEETAG